MYIIIFSFIRRLNERIDLINHAVAVRRDVAGYAPPANNILNGHSENLMLHCVRLSRFLIIQINDSGNTW
jgi:hypothetical protein